MNTIIIVMIEIAWEIIPSTLIRNIPIYSTCMEKRDFLDQVLCTTPFPRHYKLYSSQHILIEHIRKICNNNKNSENFDHHHAFNAMVLGFIHS